MNICHQNEAADLNFAALLVETGSDRQAPAVEATWEDYDAAMLLTHSLLTHSLLTPPSETWQLPGLAIQAFSESASPNGLISGDFYDFFPVNETQVGIVLGDVCGKGLAAAMHIPAVKFALRGFLSEHSCPATALACLNNLLCQSFTAGGTVRPVALSLVFWDRSTGMISCAAAGVEPPLVLRADGRCTAVAVQGLLLGVERGFSYQAATAQLAPGDVLLLVTDGITEARRDGEMFGLEGVAAAAEQAPEQVLEQVCEAALQQKLGNPARAREVSDAVVQAARAFCGGPFRDDASLLTAVF